MYGPFGYDYYDGKDKTAPREITSTELDANEMWSKVHEDGMKVEDVPELSGLPGSKFFRILGKHGMRFYIRSMLSNFGILDGNPVYRDEDWESSDQSNEMRDQ